jgi:hypothetical protein
MKMRAKIPSPKKTRDKIVGFAYLPVGWNFNRGVPAKETALKAALTLLDDLEKAGFHNTDAYPGNDGSVMVSAYVLPDYFDFDVKPSGLVTVVHAQGDEDLFYREGLSVEDAQRKIKEFASQQWHTSDCLTSTIITVESSDDLKATLSKTQKTAPVSPSLTATAPKEPVVVYVNTARSTTPPSPGRRYSIGKFHKKSFETIGA